MHTALRVHIPRKELKILTTSSSSGGNTLVTSACMHAHATSIKDIETTNYLRSIPMIIIHVI